MKLEKIFGIIYLSLAIISIIGTIIFWNTPDAGFVRYGMAITTRLAMQGEIQRKYPDLLRQYTRELCTSCHFAGFGREGCGQGLLPVTINGEKCLYFVNCKAARRDRRLALIGRR